MSRDRPVLRKEDLEAFEYQLHVFEENVEQVGQEALFSPLVKAYCRGHVAISLKLAGNVSRDGVKGPAKHFRLSYQRSHEKRLLLKAVGRRVLVLPNGGHDGIGLYEVKMPVFVDVVEGAERQEGLSDAPVFVIPSVVRLEEEDRSSVPVRESFDLGPFGGVLVPSVLPVRDAVKDRKGGTERASSRKPSTEMLSMKLEDEMIERGPEIEEKVAGRQSDALGIVEGLLVDEESVFESFSMSFRNGGISTKPCHAPVLANHVSRFLIDEFQVGLCMPELRQRPAHASTHGVTSS